MSKSRDLADLIADGAITADELDIGQIGGRRNLIINGAMQVAQRGTSVTNTLGGFDYKTVDRFINGSAGSIVAQYTISQATDAPDGFTKSLKYECTTADASQSSDEYVRVDQRLEGLDLQGLAFGTSSAKSLTISFWVKSSVTGSYNVTMNTSDELNTRQRVVQYTINSADTWEQKILTVEGDTDSGGTIRNTNEIGLILFWGLRAGSTYNSTDDGGVWHDATSAKRMYGQDAVVGANVGETWQITGVQLEVGTVATPFEHRSYGEELALCQRYARLLGDGSSGSATSATTFNIAVSLQAPMRVSPSIIVTDTSVKISDNYFSDHTSSGSTIGYSTVTSVGGRIGVTGFTGLTTGRFYNAYNNTDQTFLLLDAEL